MAANRMLTQIRGISEDDVFKIDQIHKLLEELIEEFVSTGVDEKEALKSVEFWEFRLQKLWGWPLDETKHTWNKRYLFKKQWAFTKWKCLDTGECVTIPYEVEETDFFSVGNGYIDVGRYGGYYRISGNIKQVQGKSNE